ncbi:NAD(P)H-dependent oxidoreductase [bacterium]|nr:NAD(P)H-dependent oxidoreductase [bacterium]
MNILVINGSPKGEKSVTMQYVKFIENSFKGHNFSYVNVSQRIDKIEKSKDEFNSIMEKVKESDGVIFATPVYFMVVPAQYKRFIELIHETNSQSIFANKHTFILVTSINFYDHTAVNYLHAVCDDLSMNVVSTFSAKMNDIYEKENQAKLLTLGKLFYNAIDKKIVSKKIYYPIIKSEKSFSLPKVSTKLETDKKIVIISTSKTKDKSLSQMVEHFSSLFKEGLVTIYNLNDVNIKAGCLGCMSCAFDNICVIKDDFMSFFKSSVQSADIVIFATTIEDRHLSSKLKTMLDRSFFNGHTPSIKDKQIGFIISGELGQNHNIKEMIDAYCEVQKSNLVDVVTDEDENVADLLLNLANKSLFLSNEGYIAPRTFLGKGGMKIFRDDIYEHLRVIFQKDHQYYKKNKIYDFPTKNPLQRFVNSFLYLLLKIPVVRKEVKSKMKDEMIKRHKSIAEAQLNR